VDSGSSLYVQSAGNLLEVTSTGNDFNYQPVLAGAAGTKVDEGNAYRFKPTAHDEDQDTLTFSIVNQPTWATFNAETGELKGIPAAADLGRVMIKWMAARAMMCCRILAVMIY
jgi:hypothetical protein